MDVKKYSIHEVLSKNISSFFIPPFQRSYAWGEQEIGRYFSDITRIIESERNASEKDKQEHFFGVLVFKQEKHGFGSREVVVDGQQRLTTTLLMLIALRDSINDDERKNQIDGLYLRNPSSTFSDKIKLKQVTNDWDAYKALILEKSRIPGKVTDGYNWFFGKIKNEDYTSDEYVLALSRMNVACVFLDERPYKGEDPQIIFETLNSLGKPLSFADLIRNYVLLGLDTDKQTETFDKIWHPKIEQILQERSSHFFRDYLQYKESTYFKVVSDNNTKELYASFKKYIKDKFNEETQEFIDDICRYVPWYQYIIEVNSNAKISTDKDKNKIIIELLRNIFHDIKADAFKPFVLGLLEYHQHGINNKKMTDNQLIEALFVIRTYLVRRRVLKLTQGENKEIPRLCKHIEEKEALLNDTKTHILKLLSKGIYRLRMPNDYDIESELTRIDFYNGLKKYSKLILGKTEEFISKVSVDFRDAKITIEHIMPQSIGDSDAWKREIGEDWERVHKINLHNIGNLILTEFNTEMGNKPLRDKKEKLKKSNLQYRNDVLNRPTWNGADIEAHRSEMVDRFLETFPLPMDMKYAENWDTKIQTINQEIISPLDDEAEEVVTNRKPKAVIIDDELFEVATWQDVYLSFLNWLRVNRPITFDRILDQKDGAFFRKHSVIATRNMMEIIIKDAPEMRDRYKRIADGITYSNDKKEIDNPIYAFINQSAKSFIQLINQAMQIADMGDESMVIELKTQ